MGDRIRREWGGLGLKFQLQPAVILLSASVLLTVYRYYGSSAFFDRHLSGLFHGASYGTLYGVLYQFASCLLWMLIVPAVLLRFVLRRRLPDVGMRVGDAKAGLLLLAVLLPLAVLLLVPTSRQPDFRAEYPLFRGAGAALSLFVIYELLYAVYYIAWEFFFRGFMLFGLKDFVGAANAILIQTVPSTLLHIGKPDGEIFAAVVAGVVFGIIALRTRSIVYVFLLHWLVGVTLDVLIVLTPA
jgi:membrane protease YdiL (CAAX protease family)